MRIFLTTFLALFVLNAFTQISVERSVQIEAQMDDNTGFLLLTWQPGINATDYEVGIRNGTTWNVLQPLSAADTSYLFTGFQMGNKYELQVKKNGGATGYGYIEAGIEIPPVIHRGRCMIILEKSLDSLPSLAETMAAIEGDGWIVDSIHVSMDDEVTDIRNSIITWYEATPDDNHTVYLIGHVPVPYSGQIGPDGHGDHIGAWPADVYYAEMNGRWTDNTVNNITARDARNHNVPGDGKWDNGQVASDAEVQVGRVDLSNLPAFPDDYFTLTEQYLQKNLAFRTRDFDVPRRGLVENNFASFQEGFGQNGWKNFTPMFGADQVFRGNYEVDLVDGSYLWAYACGAGSYTSMGGVGNVNNLYVAKDIQTVFAMNFGSYFGDWDRQNNLLRAALASGNILTNAWAARPNWQFHQMALGDHIGACALRSQNNLFTYESGFGARSTHVALLGDPTLRLHAMKPVRIESLKQGANNVELTWRTNPDAEAGYLVLAKDHNSGEYISIAAGPILDTTFSHMIMAQDTTMTYSVRAMKLEESASGSYYNTGIGFPASIRLESGLPASVSFEVDSASCHDRADGEVRALVQGGATPLDYAWSNMDADSVADNVAPGMYELTITSALGASKTYGPVEVFGPDSLGVDVTTTPSNGMDGTAMAQIIGGTPPYQIQWGDGTLDPNALPPGMHSVTVTDKNGCERLVEFEIKMATSVADELAHHLITSPNPAQNELRLEWTGDGIPVKLEFHDLEGRTLSSFDWNTSSAQKMNIGHLASGTYVLKLIHGSIVIHRSFVKQ